MENNLAIDFFRLVVFDDNQSREESYHRVLNSAFKILSPVHQKVNGKLRTQQNQDAMILFQMAISKGLAIRELLKGCPYENRETGAVSAPVIDPTTIAALTRTQYEAFSVFHNIYIANEDQNVVDLLHNIWVIAGLKERQRGSTPKHPEHIAKAEKEAKEIDYLITRIQSNPIFLVHSEDQQQKILDWIEKRKFEIVYRKNKLVLLPHRDMFLNTGVNEVFSNQYSILSWFIHPSYVSVLQFGQMFEKEFNEEHTYTFLRVSRIIMSMLIVDYCKYFSVAMEEFGKLSKVDQLIIYTDNKTYRSNHDFSTDAFKDLEKEIAELLKKRKKKD